MNIERQRARAVREAERTSQEGYREGEFVLDGKRAEVYPNFYPTVSWWLKTEGGRKSLTPADWARCESISHKVGRKRDLVVLDRHDDQPSIFISRNIPGGGGHPHLAIWVDEADCFVRIFRAVKVVEDETPEVVPDTFRGKDSILFAWDMTGFRFISSGTFPDDQLPDPDTSPSP